MKLLPKIYITALILTPLIPKIEVADVVAGHWVGLSLVTIIGFLILLKNNISIDFQFNKAILPLLLFTGYLLVALISIFFAINYVESLITITKVFLIFSNLYILYYLLRLNSFDDIKSYTLKIILILFIIEVLAVALPLFYLTDIFNHEFSNSLIYMKGLAGNKNIAAVSIAIKFPLVLYYIEISNNKSLRFILFLLLFLASLMIVYSGTRTAYLIVFVFFAFTIYKFLKTLKNGLHYKKTLLNLLAPLLIISSVIIYTNFSGKESRSSIQNRVEFVNPNKIDNSGKQRIRFYKQALNYSFENILMGAGIGNWKIISTYLDRENINSYVMPYNLHNDFLEVLGETGAFGFVFYTGFFISLFYLIYLLYKDKRLEDKSFVLVLAICLMGYIIDAMLNFPQFRVLNQINLIIVYFLIVGTFNSIQNNKL